MTAFENFEPVRNKESLRTQDSIGVISREDSNLLISRHALSDKATESVLPKLALVDDTKEKELKDKPATLNDIKEARVPELLKSLMDLAKLNTGPEASPEFNKQVGALKEAAGKNGYELSVTPQLVRTGAGTTDMKISAKGDPDNLTVRLVVFPEDNRTKISVSERGQKTGSTQEDAMAALKIINNRVQSNRH